MSTVAETATLAHGYTMASVDRLTRIAVGTAFSGQALDPSDRWDYAWHAIIETLYSSETAPTPHELIAAGYMGINYASGAYQRHHGRDRNTGKTAPKFSIYWRNDDPGDHFTDKMIERIALAQVLALLDDREYEAIAAVAAHETNKEAALAIGVSKGMLDKRLANARAKIYRHWFAPETPHRPKADELQCKAGHLWAEHARFTTTDGTRYCDLCNRNSLRRQRARGER